MDEQDFIEVRCPAERPHTIRGLTYPSCNTAVGGFHVDGEASIYRCPVCNTWFEVKRESENGLVFTFTILQPRRYNFLQPVRVVDHE